MRERKVVLTAEADRDMEHVEAYVTEIYRPESGRRYVRRLYSYISELSAPSRTAVSSSPDASIPKPAQWP